ncbi:MAG: energy-coupling factor transporter transmembrane protein EcfT [Bifidobacterium tibiigranuli]|jgi:cobalt/nickel transport system permease protein|uniref:energy-coupling factor transporter transmembrane component T n=2 Tax=Bifidobacterium tibiigranuli TaxID=2172043 RepID=UPI0023525A57|nr:energy-coupling factor transporter transmembrane component T [Bifidobacterium tibiigranuli]MCH4189606.1 energy-coupling factor transporter transmembrane protein EcfT [Bifidobacterium tibiigranuli]MCH4203637.1 energy-coupling factor transporter transmembrane protein EcfT [Bifidobacterium tibiigranuli]MCH4274156.1 energy-coupling factor transporter transmembrane protein EcfT [Bifidobacterium tibiigranuli]MCI1790904.1 energy-coupling factor transporter transmembrane protein EcfT [Bifidobacteriu
MNSSPSLGGIPTNETMTLPAWLREPERYTPPSDRSSFIQRNLGHMGQVLSRVGAGAPISQSPVDRALHMVSPAVRIVGIVAVIIAVNITRNMMFSYAMLAAALVLLAARPAWLMRSILIPALAICAFSLAVSLPGVFVGQYNTPARLAVKAFVTASFVIAFGWTVPWNRLIAGLRGIGCPDSLIYICDVTVQFIDILGRSMMRLLDALQLRSVGRDSRKLMSAGHVLGTLFVHAHAQARRMAEAMACRGFDGSYRIQRERLLTWANGAYSAVIVAMAALAMYLG